MTTGIDKTIIKSTYYRFFLRTTLILVLSAPVTAGPSDGSTGRSTWLAAGIGRTPAADASGGTELETEETRISAGISLFVGDAIDLDIGVDYQYTRYEYLGIDSRDRDLHRLQVPLHFATDIGSWKLKGYVAPGVSTSSNVMKDVFTEAGSEDLIVTGRVIVEGMHRDATWFAGVAHDRRFGRSRGYPVAGLEFEPHTDVRVRLAFPDPGVTIDVSDRQSVEARIYPAGHQWHVVSNDFTSDFDYRVESWRGQLNWRFPLWRALGLDLAAGYEFGREHQFTSDAGMRLDIDIDDQWFVAIGFHVGPAPSPSTNGASL
jgi:hypothetical protein